jgi:hypothetical protein
MHDVAQDSLTSVDWDGCSGDILRVHLLRQDTP